MKKKQWIAILPLFFVLVLLILSVRQFVSAQNAGQGLEVSPPSQDVSVNPGKSVTVTAKLRNPGNKTLPIKVSIEDFTAQGEEGAVAIGANSPYSITSWGDVSPSNFSLAPGEEQVVTANITAPANAAGGHYGSFVFSVTPPDTTQKNTASIAQEVASLFLVRVNGPVNEKLMLKGLSAPALSEFGPVPLSLDFVNQGNVHVKTFGLVNVRDMFGNKVADVVVTGTNVFPGAERLITAQLDKRFLIGSYTATATMYYGSQNQNLSAVTSFIVFPLRIFVIIIVILVILYLMRKRFKKATKALFK
jgi:hypothetical protein